jgi:hypothetical protein
MADVLPLLNPFKRLDTEDDAITAAQAGAVGTFVMAASSVVDALVTVAITSSDPKSVLTDGLVRALVLAGVGGFQWIRMTKLIPLVLTVLAAWGLFEAFWAVFRSMPSDMPLWYRAVGVLFNGIALLLFMAGYRGGRELARG